MAMQSAPMASPPSMSHPETIYPAPASYERAQAALAALDTARESLRSSEYSEADQRTGELLVAPTSAELARPPQSPRSFATRSRRHASRGPPHRTSTRASVTRLRLARHSALLAGE